MLGRGHSLCEGTARGTGSSMVHSWDRKQAATQCPSWVAGKCSEQRCDRVRLWVPWEGGGGGSWSRSKATPRADTAAGRDWRAHWGTLWGSFRGRALGGALGRGLARLLALLAGHLRRRSGNLREARKPEISAQSRGFPLVAPAPLAPADAPLHSGGDLEEDERS